MTHRSDTLTGPTLLDAVDALTLPRVTRVVHHSDDGAALCALTAPAYGPACGPEPHTHSTLISHDPLLVQLEAAIRETMAARPGGAASLAHTRGMLDSDALYLFTRIASMISGWAFEVKAPHRGTPAETLRAWYVAWAAHPREDGDEQIVRKALEHVAAQIEATLDPEETIQRKDPCPNPECVQGFDELTGRPTWWDRASREERLFPLIITYRPLDGMPAGGGLDVLAPSVQAVVRNARARCRACGTEWSVRALAWELEEAAAVLAGEGQDR